MKLLQFLNSACKKTTIFQVLQRLNSQHNAILKKFLIGFLLVFSVTTISAQDKKLPKVVWIGYTQFRFSSNFDDVNSFAMRRMKLKLNSAPGFSQHWGFHLQTTITSFQNEKFLLQDVLAFYKQGQFRINMGQFKPHYSLQRFQPDFEMPLTERADVINALIPNGTLGVRDIGVEGQFSANDNRIQSWLGIFNGNGIKEYRLDNSGIMLTHKTQLAFFQKHLKMGYSFMYRKADQLKISHVLPDSVAFSGDDTRFNLFAQYHAKNFHIQTEYLWASLNRQIADGWYVLAQYNINKNQISASWNQYNDLISTTSDAPVVQLGYNYAIKGDKLKLMLDNGFQIDKGNISHDLTTIQLQLFFN